MAAPLSGRRCCCCHRRRTGACRTSRVTGSSITSPTSSPPTARISPSALPVASPGSAAAAAATTAPPPPPPPLAGAGGGAGPVAGLPPGLGEVEKSAAPPAAVCSTGPGAAILDRPVAAGSEISASQPATAGRAMTSAWLLLWSCAGARDGTLFVHWIAGPAAILLEWPSADRDTGGSSERATPCVGCAPALLGGGEVECVAGWH